MSYLGRFPPGSLIRVDDNGNLVPMVGAEEQLLKIVDGNPEFVDLVVSGGTIWYVGTGAPDNGTGVEGDLYLDDSVGDFYQKTAPAEWTLVGTFTGPQGEPGPTGAEGPPGADGADGSDGSDGADGA